MSFARIALLLAFASPAVAATGPDEVCGEISAEYKLARGFCFAMHGVQTECGNVPVSEAWDAASMQAQCLGLASGSTAPCRDLEDPERPLCEAVVRHQTSGCYGDGATAGASAWCAAWTLEDSEGCGDTEFKEECEALFDAVYPDPQEVEADSQQVEALRKAALERVSDEWRPRTWMASRRDMTSFLAERDEPVQRYGTELQFNTVGVHISDVVSALSKTLGYTEDSDFEVRAIAKPFVKDQSQALQSYGTLYAAKQHVDRDGLDVSGDGGEPAFQINIDLVSGSRGDAHDKQVVMEVVFPPVPLEGIDAYYARHWEAATSALAGIGDGQLVRTGLLHDLTYDALEAALSGRFTSGVFKPRSGSLQIQLTTTLTAEEARRVPEMARLLPGELSDVDTDAMFYAVAKQYLHMRLKKGGGLLFKNPLEQYGDAGQAAYARALEDLGGYQRVAALWSASRVGRVPNPRVHDLPKDATIQNGKGASFESSRASGRLTTTADNPPPRFVRDGHPAFIVEFREASAVSQALTRKSGAMTAYIAGKSPTTSVADTIRKFGLAPPTEPEVDAEDRAVDAAPTDVDVEHVAVDAEHVAVDAEHVVVDVEHVAVDAEHVVVDVERVGADAEPTLDDAEPTLADAKPTLADAEPTLADAEPSGADEPSSELRTERMVNQTVADSGWQIYGPFRVKDGEELSATLSLHDVGRANLYVRGGKRPQSWGHKWDCREKAREGETVTCTAQGSNDYYVGVRGHRSFACPSCMSMPAEFDLNISYLGADEQAER